MHPYILYTIATIQGRVYIDEALTILDNGPLYAPMPPVGQLSLPFVFNTTMTYQNFET